MITEQLTDIEVKYLFIKKFQWHDPYQKEQYAGHPVEGRVYRAVYNKNTGHYKLFATEKDVLVFDSPQRSVETFDSEFAEITLNTILSFNILEEDLDKILEWLKTGDQEIKKLFEPQKDTTPFPLIAIQRAISEQQTKEANALAEGSDLLFKLYQLNPPKYEIVVQFLDYLIEDDQESYKNIGNYLTAHPTHGCGVNVSRALKALDTYAGDDRRNNQHIGDLFDAMTACTIEAERKLINNQID